MTSDGFWTQRELEGKRWLFHGACRRGLQRTRRRRPFWERKCHPPRSLPRPRWLDLLKFLNKKPPFELGKMGGVLLKQIQVKQDKPMGSDGLEEQVGTSRKLSF